MVKVSIIIPIYNMEKYLIECLESVINQTLEDIEIICINDGSTDGSLDILKTFQQRNSRIKVIDQKNLGVATARNRGLEEAQGEFVAFMDPDDYYPSDDALELLYSTAKRNNVAVCGGTQCFLIEGKIIYKALDSREGSRFIDNELIEYNEYQYVYGFQRFIYKREMLIENNIVFPLYIRFQDPPFMLKALLAAKKLFAVSNIVYCLRVVDKSVPYSNENVMIGIAKGLQDLLAVSLENNLMKLFNHTVSEIFDKYAMRLYNHVLKGSSSLEHEIAQINSLLKHNFTKENGESADEVKLLSTKEIFDLAEEKRKVLKMFTQQLNEREYIIIYGAAQIGREVYDYISETFTGEESKHKIRFAVTNLEDDTSTARGQRICRIEDLADLKDSAVVILATKKKFWGEISLNLEHRGFKNVIRSDIDAIRLLKK